MVCQGVTVLCSDPEHPGFAHLKKWCVDRQYKLISKKQDLIGGDVLFLVSCTEILKKERDMYKKVYVLHESDLPKGRGWSPLAWQILEGKNEITVSLLEASDNVDSGDILLKDVIELEGFELYDEIHQKSVNVKTRMMDSVLLNHRISVPQVGAPTYYRKRTPEDSRVDPEKSISEQFNLLRICDHRFKPFFEYRGHRYEITIKRL